MNRERPFKPSNTKCREDACPIAPFPMSCLFTGYHTTRIETPDVRELLTDFPVQMVVLQTGAGSGSARVSLEDPEMLEDWDRERVFVLRGQRVPVVPAPTEMMLCVARLPPAFTEPQFAALVRSYGEVRRCFLMISERTGASKGYGFVEYTMKETAMQAKSLLDGRQLDGCTLCCDWLDSNHVTFESLHSKCLYVDRLPPNFRDMGEFRKVFSSIVNPPYCQIALKNGCPQDWGLVEFSCAEDAELSRSAVDNVQLRGHSFRTAFYIPGVRAINLYLKLLNDSRAGEKSVSENKLLHLIDTFAEKTFGEWTELHEVAIKNCLLTRLQCEEDEDDLDDDEEEDMERDVCSSSDSDGDDGGGREAMEEEGSSSLDFDEVEEQLERGEVSSADSDSAEDEIEGEESSSSDGDSTEEEMEREESSSSNTDDEHIQDLHCSSGDLKRKGAAKNTQKLDHEQKNKNPRLIVKLFPEFSKTKRVDRKPTNNGNLEAEDDKENSL
ncbi:hypothetical protein B566_EDAN005080 [Ephemera danica]|nr:hypothetical protein B566_EDAN005080 [Ephemera danica]